MRCPGQDRRYWTEDAVFEVPCPKCGAAVELFKDESSGRCRSCGQRFANPRKSFDCAQWCAYAEECLGYVPERKAISDPGEGTLASRLIQATKDELSGSPPLLARALRSFQYARELLVSEGGDPRVILAGSLLVYLAESQPPPPAAAENGDSQARRAAKATAILQSAGLDGDTIACVCRLLEARWKGEELDTVESRVVQDAHTLTQLAAADLPSDPDSLQEIIAHRLKTATAKSKARSLYHA